MEGKKTPRRVPTQPGVAKVRAELQKLAVNYLLKDSV